jgi:hypothetical protein
MGVADTVGMFQSQAAAGTADVAAAMASGMSADADRRAFYEADIKPLGAEYGMEMNLDGLLPDNSLPPASEPGLYGNAGDEPIVG